MALTQRQMLVREQPKRTSKVGRRTKLLSGNESKSSEMWVFDPLWPPDLGLIAIELVPELAKFDWTR